MSESLNLTILLNRDKPKEVAVRSTTLVVNFSKEKELEDHEIWHTHSRCPLIMKTFPAIITLTLALDY